MKIYIYSIAKNEEKFAKRFIDSCKGADKVIVCDTGSTDNTKKILQENGAEVYDIQVSPFRFDLARNMALSYCNDADVVIALDLDEVLLDGWREKIEKNWTEGTTMLRSKMIFGWKDEKQTIPSYGVWSVKIHSPHSHIWTDPIHEHLLLRGGIDEKTITIDEEIMRHYPDFSKEERNTRIDMMIKWVKDEPNNTRASYSLGREYYNKGRYRDAYNELKRYLTISVAYTEKERFSRASSCNMIANSLIQLKADPNEIMTWFLRAVSENPSQREPWVNLALAWNGVGDKKMAQACIDRAKLITDDKQSIDRMDYCWEGLDNIIKQIYGK